MLLGCEFFFFFLVPMPLLLFHPLLTNLGDFVADLCTIRILIHHKGVIWSLKPRSHTLEDHPLFRDDVLGEFPLILLPLQYH